MEPTNPIAAASHPNPYPYYHSLLEGQPLYFDQEIRMWVAAHASSVVQVFADRSCRVRPVAEPVPAALDRRAAGEIFLHLVRMNDGDLHDRPKLVLQRALSSLPAPAIDSQATATAEQLLPTTLGAEALTAWVYETPVAVVADLIGFPTHERSAIARDVRDFVASLSALSTPEQLDNASAAAQRLLSRLSDTLAGLQPKSANLASYILADAQSVGWIDKDAIVANLVGLLSQTYEATAGLIGNSIVALASHQGLWDEIRSRVDGWQQLVHETSRYETPVQNTRRFVVESTTVVDTDLQPGAAILLVLAAANRDPSVNPDPRRFRVDRPNRCTFTFSRGPHACPGEAIARSIAASALTVLDRRLDSVALDQLAWKWKPSPNCRLPLFHAGNATRIA